MPHLWPIAGSAAHIAPNKNALVVGWTDGGNTSLRAHPYDINRNLEMGVGYNQTGGGGGGASSWVFNVTPKGQVIEPGMVFRGLVFTAAWDHWGRVMVGGQGIMRNGRGSIFGYDDGAGILMASSNWEEVTVAGALWQKAGDPAPKKKKKGKKGKHRAYCHRFQVWLSCRVRIPQRSI